MRWQLDVTMTNALTYLNPDQVNWRTMVWWQDLLVLEASTCGLRRVLLVAKVGAGAATVAAAAAPTLQVEPSVTKR